MDEATFLTSHQPKFYLDQNTGRTIRASYIVDGKVVIVAGYDYLCGVVLLRQSHEGRLSEHVVHKHCVSEALGVVPMPDGTVMTIDKSLNEVKLCISRRNSLDAWNYDYAFTHNSMDLSRENWPLMTARHGLDLVILVPSKNEAYVVETETGGCFAQMNINFESDKTCSAIASKRNIACVISRKFMYVVRLDLLVHKGTDDADNRISTRVQAPNVAADKTCTSATIHGDRLFVAQSPITDGVVVLHATDFNALLQLDNGDAAVWTKHVITLDQQVWKHIAASEASVSLFSTKQKNPNYQEV